jgi:hypothetical protein
MLCHQYSVARSVELHTVHFLYLPHRLPYILYQSTPYIKAVDNAVSLSSVIPVSRFLFVTIEYNDGGIGWRLVGGTCLGQ